MSSNRFLNAQLARFEQNKKPLIAKKAKLDAKIAELQQELNTLDTQIAAVDKVKQLFIENNPMVPEVSEGAAPQQPESVIPAEAITETVVTDNISEAEIGQASPVQQINGQEEMSNGWEGK